MAQQAEGDDGMTDAAELLPCPFCGGEAMLQTVWRASFEAACDSCTARGPRASAPAEAIAAWNRRHPMVVEEADVSELPEELRPGRKVI